MRLTPDVLTRTADLRAGACDLAPEGIREPLTRICDDLALHPPTALGRLVVGESLVQGLANRRRLQRVATVSGDEAAPIVLIGWFRTGTSFLQALLASLRGLGHVPMHRLVEPVPRRGSALRVRAGLALMRRLAPEVHRLHPVSAHGPDECWMLLLSDLLVDGFAFHWSLPSYDAWLRGVDREPAYRAYARAVWWLEGDLGTRLVMKDPGHILALDVLPRVLPRARLVWTHRDPAACIASHAALTAAQHRLVYGRSDALRAGRESFLRMASAIDRALPHFDDRAITHVAFTDLVGDPVGTVRRLCAAWDLRFDATAVRTTADELLRAPRQPPTPLAAWGLDPNVIVERFRSYGERTGAWTQPGG